MKFLKQTLRLIAASPILSAIIIAGTAVTMAFVIVVTMTYRFRVADMPPESHRSQTLHLAPGQIHHVDGYDYSHGLGKEPYEQLLTDLPGVEDVTWSGYLDKNTVMIPGADEKLRLFTLTVPVNWFDRFDYSFIAGGRFTLPNSSDDPREVLMSRSAARKLFGSDDFDSLIGKEILVNFKPVRLTGIFEDVSSVFNRAYAEVLMPFRLETNPGLQGARIPVLFLSPGTTKKDVMTELERRESIFNSQGRDYVYHFEDAYTQVENSFFRDKGINPDIVFVMLVTVLLIIPAVGISGLVNAQIQSRSSEIAIRKAYGAPDSSIIMSFFRESLVSAVIGTILGYILAIIDINLCSDWIFGDVRGDIIINSSMIFNNGIIITAFFGCIAFSLIATVIPAWIATRRNIAVTLKGGEQ